MARQRFIHPELWKDPMFGKLPPVEQVMFIGLFSIADDDGRLLADAAYLRSELFPYKDYTNKKVQTIRDAVVEKMGNVHLYRADGLDYIALLKWSDYQKPKYPKPSKLPAPFLPDSPKPSPTLEKDSPSDYSLDRAGQGRDGLMGRVGQESQDPAEIDNEVENLLKLGGCDDNSRTVIAVYAKRLPLARVADIRQRAQQGHKGIGWAITAMKRELGEAA